MSEITYTFTVEYPVNYNCEICDKPIYYKNRKPVFLSNSVESMHRFECEICYRKLDKIMAKNKND